MNVLILKVSAIGDVIHTLPAAYLIKSYCPNVRVDWVVQEKAAGLVLGNPLIDKVWVLPNKFLLPKNWLRTYEMICELRSQRWDLIIDFQGILKTSILIWFLKGVKIGFDKNNARDKFSTLFTNHQYCPTYINIVQKNLSLASFACGTLFDSTQCPTIGLLKSKFSLPIKDCDKNMIDCWWQENNIEKLVVVAPNTTWKSKQWPDDCWRLFLKNLAAKLDTMSKISGKRIVAAIAGSSFGNQAEILASFAATERLPALIMPAWNLSCMGYLISRSTLLIAPDTGLLHMADFVGTRSIGIFGPTLAKKHGPFFSEKNIANVVQVECAHRYQKFHEKSKYGGEIGDCMYKLSPDRLLDLVIDNVKD
jgi:lipopolysaccharide heptosyltransferase I